MDDNHSSSPAFGQADLSNCEREQIHLAGSIQPHGVLLVVEHPSYNIIQASDNAEARLASKRPVAGQSIEALGGNLLNKIKACVRRSQRTTPIAFRCRTGEARTEYNALLHWVDENALIVELEPAGPRVDLRQKMEGAISSFLSASSLDHLCDEASKVLRELTGYDRVMIYKFDADGHGQVYAESKREDLESYLGNWYPASDIPQIARRLYERNRVRMLVDVHYVPVPVSPAKFPVTGKDLDMSLCFLRSMSPIHIEYLKNMGVSATLVASLMVGEKLWGLISCHHYSPRHTHYEHRTGCEVLAEVLSTRIASLESFARARVEMSVRRLEEMMLASVSRYGDWKSDLFDRPKTLLETVHATGVALVFEEKLYTAGDIPGTHDIRKLISWLDTKLTPQAPSFATKSIASEDPEFSGLTAVASGVLAIRIPDAQGEYLIWFRPERRHTVTWGGDPMKPFLTGGSPSDLSPRRSFAQWHQVVEGSSAPWTQADIATARMVSDSVADVILQFRALRLLILQNQLRKVRRDVRLSAELAVVADVDGRILMASQAFGLLSEAIHPPLQTLSDLSELFEDPAAVRSRLTDLTKSKHIWRGEAALRAANNETTPLLVRGEPVFSGPDTLLGYILLFTDLRQQKAAESARRQSLRSIVEAQEFLSGRLPPDGLMDYLSLLSLVVGNAQRATLEITDGIDLESMPRMVGSVKSSVARTAELLENLIAQTAPDE
jgi:light-regulated signal transduction histidine kinase (bacteriophytochrome)